MEAEKARHQFARDEAERVARETTRQYEARQAEDAAREAREALSQLEIDTTQRQIELVRRRAEVAAEATQVQAEGGDVDEQLEVIAVELERLESSRQAALNRELEEQLQALAPVVDAQREAVGASGVADLSKEYLEQAGKHTTAWKRWGTGLIVAMSATVGSGLFLFSHDKVPTGTITGPTVVDLVRNLFVIGLLLYAVRITSLQFRVHRHLEAVARNKAAALATFNRIVVVASEKEIRNSLAVVLAQAVFSSDETGFVDATQDHVTLIERLAATPRIGI
jgi:hypothetical protein